MHYISIEIKDTIDLSDREKSLLQTTIMNFAAMTNALIVKEDMVITPLESGEMGVTMTYSKSLDSEVAESMKLSLSNRFTNFFKMADIGLKAQVELK
ncbi:MAG TPA: hypothetical protein VK142_08995 [Bacillota bacterium]|nr:hypothetical protein [Bacillota bacterium]